MIETIIIFIIILAVLIFVHELGHFLFARMFGIRVDEFALGFGPKIWSKKVTSAKHGDMVYAINAVPFGGYVKIYGENGESEEGKEGGKISHGSSRSFVNKPRHIQAAVLFAGILFNFLFAWIIVSGAFMGGMPVSAEDYSQYSVRFRNERIVIVDVTPGSPADKAGLTTGDTIVSISSISGQALTIQAIQSVVDTSAGSPITIGYLIHNKDKTSTDVKTATLNPVKGIQDITSGHYAIGIAMDNAATLSLPLPFAVKEGVKYTWNVIEVTIFGIKDLVVAAFQGNRTILSEVSGPVGIYGLVGQAAESGLANIILLTAIISINLGVINLLPFPALDGGRILFVAIEAIIRRPIKANVANAVNTFGFALLILLMIVVTYHDIIKLI